MARDRITFGGDLGQLLVDVDSFKDQVSKRISEIDGQVSSLRTDLDDTKAEVDQLHSTDQSMSELLEKHASLIEQLQSKHESLGSAVTADSAEIEALKDSFLAISERISELEQVDRDTYEELVGLTKKLESLTDSLNAEQAELKRMISVQDNMLSGLQTGLLKLNDAHTSTSEQLSEDISAVRQDLGTQADLVASLRSDLETVKKDIADIETLLDESVSVDEMTVGRIAALVSQINDLTKRVEALEEHHTPKDSSSSGSGSTLLLLGLAGAAAALLLGGK